MDKEKFLELNKSYLKIDEYLSKKETQEDIDFNKKIEAILNVENVFI